MAFDFPASPTTGQIYQPTGGPAWQYDGEKWKGGAIAGPQKETLIDLAGKTTVDVAVPTWAKVARVTAVIQPTANGGLYLQISGDGTTFLTGSNYYSNGPFHAVAPPAFSTNAGSTATSWVISGGHDNTTVPINVTAEIPLTRANDANFSYKSHSSSYHTTTAYLTYWFSGYVAAAVMPGLLTLKALRFIGFTAKAGSYIHIKWLGDDAQIPTQNAIPDAPSDNGEYVRVNGVWRLKHQTFILDGVAALDTSMPVGAKMMLARGATYSSTAAAAGLQAHVSVDGTNFLTGASDYYYGGMLHYTGSSGYINLPGTVTNRLVLSPGVDNAALPGVFHWTQQIVRSAPSLHWTGMMVAEGYNAAATNLHQDEQLRLYVMNTASASILDIKKIRWSNSSGVVFGPNSVINCEWVY